MTHVFRAYWGRQNGRLKCRFPSDLIHGLSVVLVTASEGIDPNIGNPNFRFVGDANVRVENISPTEGFVFFVVSVDWGEPLHIYTDIVVLDERP